MRPKPFSISGSITADTSTRHFSALAQIAQGRGPPCKEARTHASEKKNSYKNSKLVDYLGRDGNRVDWGGIPPPGIEPRPQVPETCVISISPRGHGRYSIIYQRRSNVVGEGWPCAQGRERGRQVVSAVGAMVEGGGYRSSLSIVNMASSSYSRLSRYNSG